MELMPLDEVLLREELIDRMTSANLSAESQGAALQTANRLFAMSDRGESRLFTRSEVAQILAAIDAGKVPDVEKAGIDLRQVFG